MSKSSSSSGWGTAFSLASAGAKVAYNNKGTAVKAAKVAYQHKETVAKGAKFAYENRETIAKAAKFADENKETIAKGAKWAQENPEAAKYIYDNKDVVIGVASTLGDTDSSTQALTGDEHIHKSQKCSCIIL